SRDEDGRQDEARARDDEPASALLLVPDMDRHLRGVGAGYQVCGPDEIEKMLPGEPAAAVDDLVLHHRDVRGRSAERDHAELQEEPRDVTKAAARRHGLDFAVCWSAGAVMIVPTERRLIHGGASVWRSRLTRIEWIATIYGYQFLCGIDNLLHSAAAG